MYCICCKKNKIVPGPYSENMSEEDFIWKVEEKKIKDRGAQEYFKSEVQTTTADNRLWTGGIVQIINGGYGSNHDTDKYIIAICDDCVTSNMEDGTLLFHGNYMHPNEPFVEEEINKSKQIYRRRKNLDDLV